MLIAGLWALYNHTTFGLQARAAMQNPAMARALGVDTERVYMLTFSLGAGEARWRVLVGLHRGKAG